MASKVPPPPQPVGKRPSRLGKESIKLIEENQTQLDNVPTREEVLKLLVPAIVGDGQKNTVIDALLQAMPPAAVASNPAVNVPVEDVELYALLTIASKSAVVDALLASMDAATVANNPAVGMQEASVLRYQAAKPKLQNVGLNKSEREKVKELNTTNSLTAEQIAQQLGKPLDLVTQTIAAFKDRKRRPFAGCEKESEGTGKQQPTFLLPVDRATISMDFSDPSETIKKEGDARLLKGQCTCKTTSRRCFNFIVLGPTGAGKTTLIDSYCNFLTGVDFYDSFRFKLIDERAVRQATADALAQDSAKGDVGGKKKNVQSVSQTSAVTIYHIPSTWINHLRGRFETEEYCINIIDTPGFADTRGAHIDAKITKMIAATLSSLDSIDNMLFVTKSNDNRVDAAARHVMTSVLKMFAVDVGDRFMAMLTFSDGKEPMAKDALRDAGLVFDVYCQFNNSAIWETADIAATRQFFQLGYTNFAEFGDTLAKMKKAAVSTSRTQQVIQKRDALQELSVKAQHSCNSLTKNMGEFQSHMTAITKNADEFNSNQKYVETVYCDQVEKRDYGSDVTQCKKCAGLTEKGYGNCHLGCNIGDDKARCCVMDDRGFCNKCGCHFHDHINSRQYYVSVKKPFDQEDALKKANLDGATKKLDSSSKRLVALLTEQINMVNQYKNCKNTLRQCDAFLTEFAIHKKPFHGTDYIEMQLDNMRESGEEKSDPGKFKVLEKMLEDQRALQQLEERSLHELEKQSPGNIKKPEDRRKTIEVKVDDVYFAKVIADLTAQRQTILSQSAAKKNDKTWWASLGAQFKGIFG